MGSSAISKVYRAACEMPISHLYANFQTTLLWTRSKRGLAMPICSSLSLNAGAPGSLADSILGRYSPLKTKIELVCFKIHFGLYKYFYLGLYIS